jgi:hypothetical protein
MKLSRSRQDFLLGFSSLFWRRDPPEADTPDNDAYGACLHTPQRWRQRGVKKPPAVDQGLLTFRVFGLSMDKKESRRADSNRSPNLITSDNSGVAGVCRALQMPHI